jgi:hypothetical protein
MPCAARAVMNSLPLAEECNRQQPVARHDGQA